MVYRILSTWSAPMPEHEAEFEDYYINVHCPFAARLPGVQHLYLTRASEGIDATPPDFYRIAELWFASKEAFIAATESKEWAEMRVDAGYVHEKWGCRLSSGQGDLVDFPLDPGGLRPISGADG